MMFSQFTFKHRLIGAIFLVSLAVIIVPALFDTPKVDTLASKDALPQAPTHAAWQELDKVEYAFTELTQHVSAENEQTASEETAPITTPLTELAAAPLSAPMPAVADNHTPVDIVSAPTPVANTETNTETLKPETATPAAVAVAEVIAPTPTPTATSAETPAVVASTHTSPEKIAIPARGTVDNAPAESKVIASTEKLITNNAWAVQLGAFSKVANAQALLERLQKNGYTAYIQHMNDSQLTRVLVGAEEEKQQAAALLTELDNTMHLKGIIVKFNPENAG